MPRIKAATVPEHRAALRQALLAAAKAIVIAEGAEALRFAEVADRAGVARPSVYDYFPTRSDLLLALVALEVPPWRDEIVAALEGARTPQARVEAFVRTQLRLVAEGRHELPFALSRGNLEPEVQAEVERIHADIGDLLQRALQELGVRERTMALSLVMGVVRSGIELLATGATLARTSEGAVRFVSGGLMAMTPKPPAGREKSETRPNSPPRARPAGRGAR